MSTDDEVQPKSVLKKALTAVGLVAFLFAVLVIGAILRQQGL